MKKLPGSAVLSPEAEGRSSLTDGCFGHLVGAPLNAQKSPNQGLGLFYFFLKYMVWYSQHDFLLSRPLVLKCEYASNHLDFLLKHSLLNTTPSYQYI